MIVIGFAGFRVGRVCYIRLALPDRASLDTSREAGLKIWLFGGTGVLSG